MINAGVFQAAPEHLGHSTTALGVYRMGSGMAGALSFEYCVT